MGIAPAIRDSENLNNLRFRFRCPPQITPEGLAGSFHLPHGVFKKRIVSHANFPGT
jgi:hypothetical protein